MPMTSSGEPSGNASSRLRSKSAQGRAEQRVATQADIAERVGVSRQLVGLVFRGAPGVGAETEAKIRTAAKELGYRPNVAAQSLRRDASKHIGVVFHIAESAMTELLPALYAEAEKEGFDLILSAVSSFRDENQAIDEIMSFRCSGLILIASTLSVSKLQKMAREVPLVSLGRRLDKVRCGVVSSKGESGVFDAVEYLVGLGHKKIGYVWAKDMLDGEYRLEGYVSAMDKYRLNKQIVPISGDFAERGGAAAAEVFLKKEMPTAILCNNDQSAFGLSMRLLQAGIKIPQDVSVIGYDDTIAQYEFLNLTTVRQEPQELALAAVKDLVARIRGEKYLSETFLTSSKLVKRASTAAPHE